MKTSITLFLSDILPHRRKIYHKIVKNKIFKNQKTDDVFKHLKKIGLDGFELMLPQYATTTDADILEVKKFTTKYKFPVLSVHQALRFLTATKVNEIARLFEIADMVGAKVIVLHINSARKQVFNESYVQTLHELEKKYKVKVTFENMEKHIESYFHAHRWHAVKFSTLIQRINFHITFDIVHLAHSGGDILRFYKDNKDRIINIHLSDYRSHPLNGSLRPLRYKHMPLGDGELPIDAFVALLQKEKYQGILNLELHSDIHGVEKSVSMVNQIIHSRKSAQQVAN
ncbi:MAG TPA: sugar phosphate isomerase/epimerase family protein [Candidatus Acidoferrales bacterium]|nr:sugar phosphate isomerase/epimerase family protein [Candidatus Acidoferrales bacterium]